MKRLSIFIICVMLWAMPAFANDIDRSAAADHLNMLRSDRNLDNLQYSTRLEKTARAHAEDMVRNGFFSHTGSDGSGIGARLKRSGYGYCAAAENIASGQPNLEDVMTSWATSRGHRKNMLSKKVSEFALVRAAGNIWVMVLARPGC